jgi:hypothetical protein
MNPLEAAAEKILTDNGLGTSEFEKLAFALGAAYERERAKGLVEALEMIAHNYPGDPVIGVTPRDLAKDALQKWRMD